MFKKIILTVLIIICMATIFTLSGQEAKESAELSRGTVEKIVNSTPVIKDLPKEEKKEIVSEVHTAVRKTAHFALYLILGMLVYMLALEFGIRYSFAAALAFCLIFAISDEIHQLFIDGRSAEIRDVCIDTAGAVTGELLVNVLKKIKKKCAFFTKFA